ncbi:MAG: helix-turn-helix transcriptional regulator [Oscillospiraceae bacterium]
MGNKVREYREYHGVGQQWLARKAKCGRTTIYEIERGGRLPNVVTARPPSTPRASRRREACPVNNARRRRLRFLISAHG